jgi:hypothetical protein
MEMETNKRSRAAHARTIVRETPATTELASEEHLKDARREIILERRNKLHSMSDKIANSNFYYLNWYYPEGRDEWPQHNNLRYVGKMYPYAEGGRLLIDEPRHSYEFEACEAKRPVLKKLGYRYLVIKPEMSIEECLEELATLEETK